MGDVALAVEDMKELVRKGEFVKARERGLKGEGPWLGLTMADVLQDGTGKVVGRGASSTVLAGEFGGHRIVVKRPKLSTNDDLERLRKEIIIMADLRDHPGVIRLVGARCLPPDYFIVLERADTTLESAIHECGWRPGLTRACQTLRRICDAMAYIHRKGVLHRDIKPGNVLLDASRCNPRITDFGIAEYESSLLAEHKDPSMLMGKNGFHKRHMVGTLEYMPPEVLLRTAPHTKAADVYAVAIMSNEVITGTFPFSDCTTDNPKAHTILEMGYGRQELAAAVSAENLRPILSASTPGSLLALLEEAWHHEPDRRPAFDAITTRLDDIIGKDTGGSSVQELDTFVPPTTVLLTSEPESSSPSEGTDSMGQSFVLPRGEFIPTGETVPWLDGAVSMAKPVITHGTFETSGFRGADKMEDTNITVEEFCSRRGVRLFGVFDGHRGAEAANYMQQTFSQHLSAAIHQEKSPSAAMTRAFMSSEQGFRTEMDDAWHQRVRTMGAATAGTRNFPGTTAIAALVYGNHIVVGNLGDCRALLCRNGEPVQISRDHVASNAAERERILQSGGEVVRVNDTWRVHPLMIEVTRSIGDFDMKGAGLVANVEVDEIEITRNDEFLILGSDGLYERLSNEEIIGLVHDTVKQPLMCAKRLVTEALTRGTQDNITCQVIFLCPTETLERIYAKGEQKYKFTRTEYGSRSTHITADETRDTY